MTATTADPASHEPADPLALGLAAIGVAVLVVAMFLPAVSPPATFPTVIDNQFIQHDGWIAGALALVGGGGLLAVYRSGVSLPRQFTVFAAGLGASVFAAYALFQESWRTIRYAGPTDGFDLQAKLEAIAASTVAAPGAAVYATLVGGLLLSAGGLLLHRSQRIPVA